MSRIEQIKAEQKKLADELEGEMLYDINPTPTQSLQEACLKYHRPRD